MTPPPTAAEAVTEDTKLPAMVLLALQIVSFAEHDLDFLSDSQLTGSSDKLPYVGDRDLPDFVVGSDRAVEWSGAFVIISRPSLTESHYR